MWEILTSFLEKIPSSIKRHAAEAAVKHVTERFSSSGRVARRERNEAIERVESTVSHLTQEITDSQKHLERVHSQFSHQLANVEEGLLKLQNQNRDTDKRATTLEKQLNGLASTAKMWGIVFSSAVLIGIALIIWLLVRTS